MIHKPQIEFFYFNDVQELSGQNFRVGYTSLAGATDSINDYAPVAGDSGSRVAAYWPFTAFQNTDGSLELVTYMIYSPWANQTLPITASKGTGLAIVPQTASFVAPYTSGLLYRTEDGELGGYWLTWNETGTTWDMGSSMSPFPTIPPPRRTLPISGLTSINLYQKLYPSRRHLPLRHSPLPARHPPL